MKSADLISVTDLTVRAGGRELVGGVSFSAGRGRVLGLVGESGSGKSLTCLALLGLLPVGVQAEGEISLSGLPAAKQDMRTIRGRHIAMILQNPMSCFDPVFTIRTHFRETLAAHGMCGEGWETRMLAALEEVGFPSPAPVVELYPFQMSGGMLQRVMIGLALILDAPFLIADEPTTDLDTVAQARVLDLLCKLKRERGMGMLLVTHDLGVIARIADDMAVMRHGRIVEQGPVSEVFNAPAHPYTQELIAAHLRFSGYDEN
jgi:nickel transport system ATP-binding protein